MAKKKNKEKTVRTTLTLHEKVDEWARELQNQEGYTTFGDFISALIRERRERLEDRRAAMVASEHLLRSASELKKQ